MAGTYFGYAERNVESQINWAEVGKSMSDMLAEEMRIREEKKAEIDEASRKFGEVLMDNPMGVFDKANNFSLEFADNASQYRLMQDRLLKSGQLSVKDYIIARENIKSGTQRMYKMIRDAEAEHKLKMERYETGVSQFREAWDMEQIEGLAKFDVSKALIDAPTGILSIGIWSDVTKKGKVPPDSSESIAAMEQRLKQTYDAFETKKNVDEAIDRLGEVQTAELIKAAGAGGLEYFISNIDAKTADYKVEAKEIARNYLDYEADVIGQWFSNPNNLTSVLTEDVGNVTRDRLELMGLSQAEIDNIMKGDTKITYTYDKSEWQRDKSNRLIYLDRTEDARGVPVFKDGQKKMAEDFLRTYMRAGIDTKKTMTSAGRIPYAPQPRGGTTTTPTETPEYTFDEVFMITEGDKFKPDSIDYDDDGDTVTYLDRYIQSIMGGAASGLEAKKLYWTNGVYIVDGDGNEVGRLEFSQSDPEQRAKDIEALKETILNIALSSTSMTMDAKDKDRVVRDFQIIMDRNQNAAGATGSSGSNTGVTIPRPPQQQ